MFDVTSATNKAGILRALITNMKVRRQGVKFVAEKLGISEQHLYRIMAGQRNPSEGLLANWAKLYNRELIAAYRLERAPIGAINEKASNGERHD